MTRIQRKSGNQYIGKLKKKKSGVYSKSGFPRGGFDQF